MKGKTTLLLVLTVPIIFGPVLFGLRHRRQERAGRIAATGFNLGDYAPDFELRTLDGSTVKLSNLRGKPVLLNFWATWCAPCQVETPWLVDLDNRYREKGLEIIGVSLDEGERQTVASFVNNKGIRYRVLVGNSSIADAYGGVRFMPQSYFIDRSGRIRKATTGLTGEDDLESGIKELLRD